MNTSELTDDSEAEGYLFPEAFEVTEDGAEYFGYRELEDE